MTAEQLLTQLPDLSVNTIKGPWLEAMLAEFAKIKDCLEDASALKLQSHYDLKHFDEVCLVLLDEIVT